MPRIPLSASEESPRKSLHLFSTPLETSAQESCGYDDRVLTFDDEFSLMDLPNVPKDDPVYESPVNAMKKPATVIPFELDDLDSDEDDGKVEKEEPSVSSDSSDDDSWTESEISANEIPPYQLMESQISQSSLNSSTISCGFLASADGDRKPISALHNFKEITVSNCGTTVETTTPQTEDEEEEEDEERKKITWDLLVVVERAMLTVTTEAFQMRDSANEHAKQLEKTMVDWDAKIRFSERLEDLDSRFQITERLKSLSCDVNERTAIIATDMLRMMTIIKEKIVMGKENESEISTPKCESSTTS